MIDMFTTFYREIQVVRLKSLIVILCMLARFISFIVTPILIFFLKLARGLDYRVPLYNMDMLALKYL